MPREYNLNEFTALNHLAVSRYTFYKNELFNNSNEDLQKEIKSFIQLFCAHDFANADYTIIQSGTKEFQDFDDWISQISIETILIYLTYIIWTDKSVPGYFISKISDKTLEKILSRLEHNLSVYKVKHLQQYNSHPLSQSEEFKVINS